MLLRILQVHIKKKLCEVLFWLPARNIQNLSWFSSHIQVHKSPTLSWDSLLHCCLYSSLLLVIFSSLLVSVRELKNTIGLGNTLEFFSDIFGSNHKHKKQQQLQTVELMVSMDCKGCELKVKKALSSLKGFLAYSLSQCVSAFYIEVSCDNLLCSNICL